MISSFTLKFLSKEEVNFRRKTDYAMVVMKKFQLRIQQDPVKYGRTCKICKEKHPTGLHGFTFKRKSASSNDGTDSNDLIVKSN